MEFSPKKILFVLLFAVLALVAGRLNFSQLVGAPNQFFTVFQFFGPIAGAFLGPIVGGLSVLIAETANFFILGKELNIINVLRLFPMVFAAIYFGTSKKKDWSLIVPILAIAAFVLHPVGAQVWYYAVMFWSIPIVMKLFFADRLFAKSLGATFTAHSVGGAIWIYVFPTTAPYWTALIPVVVFERVLFAIGIAVSYIALNTLLSRVEQKLPTGVVSVDKKYDLFKMLALRN